MSWKVCIRFPNGKERALRSCNDREVALRYIDAIYAQGYPMHIAYIVRPTELLVHSQPDPIPSLQVT